MEKAKQGWRSLLDRDLKLKIPLTVFILAVVLAIGLELRVQSVRLTVVDGPIRADAKDYVSYGLNLKRRGVYSRADGVLTGDISVPAPDAVRSPGYPLFLFPFLDKELTVSVQTVLLAQALLSVLTVLLSYFLFRAAFTAPWALATAALVALSPHLITMNVYVLTETLFCFFLVLFAWVFVKASAMQKNRWWLATGVVLALGALTRPSLEYLIVPLAGFVFFGGGLRTRRVALHATLLVLLGFALVYLPWIGRNLYHFGKTGDSTLMVSTVHHGLYPDFRFNDDPATFGYPYRFDPRSAEISTSVSAVLREALTRFEQAPTKQAEWFFLGKPWTFWSWNMVEGPGDVFIYPILQSPYFTLPHFSATHWLMRSIHTPLVILAFIGSVLPWIPTLSAAE